MLFLMERIDEGRYEDYDSFVVCADNAEEAFQMCKEKEPLFQHNKTRWTRLTDTMPKGIILGSFNCNP